VAEKELLEVFRNAIAGHRSLLEKGKILHRDVSENNIIIREYATVGPPEGLLIDLDLAKGIHHEMRPFCDRLARNICNTAISEKSCREGYDDARRRHCKSTIPAILVLPAKLKPHETDRQQDLLQRSSNSS
jgi:hypothetical protein